MRSRAAHRVVVSLSVALLGGVAAPLVAADLSGQVFRDRDGNGLPDPGEDGVAATLEVVGARDAGGVVDVNAIAGLDGLFFVGAADLSDGCFAVRATPRAGFRFGLPRRDCPGMGLAEPVGTRRYSSPRHLVDAVRGGSLLHIALGDSIAEPVSGCTIVARLSTDYLGWLGDRLECLVPGAVTDNEAIGGKLSYDLLRPAGTCGPPNLPIPGDPDPRCNNIFDTIARTPDVISISIGGNDWLGSEPADQSEPFVPAEVQVSVDALLAARANLQAILSTLASELPTTDVRINTVYDNDADGCGASDFHNIWVPIWDQMLRQVAWGQGDRFSVVEVYPEYAHQDLNGGACCGARTRICQFFDGIHPNADGAKLHLEKAWDAVGGISLGPRDGIGRSSNPDLLLPAVELVSIRFPSVVEDRAGGTVDPDFALARDGRPARVPAGVGELVLSGFDDLPTGIVPTDVVVVVRYRTDAVASDESDGHFFEAAVDGLFAAPGYTVTGWNTLVPIVGAGANAPAPNALPFVGQWREVRAQVTKNLVDDGRATGSYSFPSIDWVDIANVAVRLRGAVRGVADDVRIEWDAAWLEIYGYHAPGPLDVYRAEVAAGLVVAENLIGATSSPPYDDVLPAAPILYFAVDDGGGLPAKILLTRDNDLLTRIHW